MAWLEVRKKKKGKKGNILARNSMDLLQLFKKEWMVGTPELEEGAHVPVISGRCPWEKSQPSRYQCRRQGPDNYFGKASMWQSGAWKKGKTLRESYKSQY